MIANGGIKCDTDKFVVTNETGRTGIGGIASTTYMLKVTGSEHITSNLDVSGTLGVTGNTTVGGTLGVTGDTTITGVLYANKGINCDNGKFVVADASGATGIGGNVSTEMLKVYGTSNITGNTAVGGTLGVIGNTTITGQLNANGGIKCDTNKFVVTNDTGNTGIGGVASTEKLKVYGDVSITGNINVDGSFNFKEIIKNTINNNIEFSNQLDIKNQGTGPALKVSQYGTNDSDNVALFNAGTEGNALLIDSTGKSIFYKDVSMSSSLNISSSLTVNGVTNASVPRGIIVMWSGSNNNIPTGWVLCNGLNGTPNLMNRFIIGSGSTYTTSNTGGNSTVTLATVNLPAHNHTGTTVANGDHSHTGTTVANGNHTHSGTTTTNGNHSHSGTTTTNGHHAHTILMRISNGSGYGTGNPVAANYDQGSQDCGTYGAGDHYHTFNTTTNGNHNHTFNTSTTGSHNHTFTTNTTGSHTHTFTTNNTGSGTAFNILPPYYSLAYIMKT